MLETRRALLTGLAILPASIAAPAVAQPIGLPVACHDLPAMWHRYLIDTGAYRAAREAHGRAMKALPWWARPGPSYVNSQGELCGAESHCPASESYTLPEGRGLRLIRESAHHIDQVFRTFVNIHEADRAQAYKDRAIAELEQRLAAQCEEQHHVGLPEVLRKMDEADDAAWTSRTAILDLLPTSLDVIAAQIVLEAMTECGGDDAFKSSSTLCIVSVALRGMLPTLAGELATDVAEFVNQGDRVLGDTRAWRGISA